MIDKIVKLMKYETAGDPITGLKWTRKTTQKVADELIALGIDVSANTVARLLKQMKYSLRVNHKKLTIKSDPNRDEQFVYIAELRERFAGRGDPIVSVDTKKRELVGNFKNAGVAWRTEPLLVNDHDFRSDALGIGIPYGIYDVQANLGAVFLGTSHNTPQFAVDNLERWWRYDGCWRYRKARELLILADGGGSNGPNSRPWKLGLQEKLCDRHDLTVTVAHYPTGASKWNPIEHRLFGEISKNWAGRPLDSYETVLKFIRTTGTSTGLRVKAYMATKYYPLGVKVSDDEMAKVRLERHITQGKRNYTLRPR